MATRYAESYVQAMSDCATICIETLSYCLDQGGRHVKRQQVRLLIDCSEICRTSADLILRDSGKTVEVCALAADICDECAEACATFEGDARMRACAESCKSCAASCRQAAGMAPTV